jgi:hypothetical protein
MTDDRQARRDPLNRGSVLILSKKRSPISPILTFPLLDQIREIGGRFCVCGMLLFDGELMRRQDFYFVEFKDITGGALQKHAHLPTFSQVKITGIASIP